MKRFETRREEREQADEEEGDSTDGMIPPQTDVDRTGMDGRWNEVDGRDVATNTRPMRE